MTCKLQENSKTNGRWTKEEHEKFILGILSTYLGLQLYGKDWKKIQALIGTRNGAQIRSHAQKFFIKIKKESDTNENADNWEQTLESPPDHLNQQSSIAQSMAEPDTNPDYSYYLNKMYISFYERVQKDALKESFDFWDSLVDHKPIGGFELPGIQRRKYSFVSLASDKDEYEGIQPSKKIKCE